jgi:hypothetical protein
MNNFEEFIQERKEDIQNIEHVFCKKGGCAIPFDFLEEKAKDNEDLEFLASEAKNSCMRYLEVILRYIEADNRIKEGGRDVAEELSEVDNLRLKTHNAIIGDFNALRRFCNKNEIPLNIFDGIEPENRVAYGKIALESSFEVTRKFLKNQKKNNED